MQVRNANAQDSRRIFEWRNDPITISTSRTQAGVDWDGHQRWFPAQLAKPDTVCLIGETDGESCGVVWFREGRAGVWETSVNLSPAFRGKKLSAPMLKAAVDWMRSNKAASRFSTEIQDSNVASIKMFEHCGFVYVHPSPGFGTYCADLSALDGEKLKIISQIETVRAGNNVNWMDLLRLAFSVAPDDAKALVRKINADDNRISALFSQLAE